VVNDGRYVDVGCHHPVINNNSYWFYHQWGGGGLVVDPQEQFKALYRQLRPRDTFVQCAVGTSPDPVELFEFRDSTLTTTSPEQARLYETRGREGMRGRRVPSRSFASLIADAGLDRVDVCFIDVEGSELDVLQSMDFASLRPRLIVVEDKLVHPGRISPCGDLLLDAGYGLAAKTMLDSFFIDLTSSAFAWLPRAVVLGR
jgi:FkbM family methyltransferase